MRAIDLFCGAGGLSLGLKQAGFDVVAAFEFNKDAILSHGVNFPDTEHFQQNVCKVDFKQFNNIDLVAGGPPCQPFSVSGKQKGMKDERDMVPQFIRAVTEIQPNAFLMENVEGLITEKFKPYLLAKIDELKALGYHINWQVLNAADYGVAQNRKRLFIVGFKNINDYQFPFPTHGDSLPFMTVEEVLKDTPLDTPNSAKIVYAKNPILRKSPYAGMLFNGQGRPLPLKGLSHTITATSGGNRTHIICNEEELKEYHEHLMKGGVPKQGLFNGRRLTARESARIQSFPDDFIFLGAKTKQYTQIGNAVPPLLAYAVGKSIFEYL